MIEFPTTLKDLLELVMKGLKSPRTTAYVIAPGLVMTFGFAVLGKADLVQHPQNLLALLPLETRVTAAGEVVPFEGLVVFADSNVEPVAIPFEPRGATELLVSLDNTTFRTNRERIRLKDDQLHIGAPLLGTGEVTIIVQGTRATGSVNFPGRQVPLAELLLPSRRSSLVATWALAISLAIALSFWAELRPTAAQDSSAPAS